MLPTRSASGRRFMAGVVGGGQVLDVAGFGVVAAFPFTLRDPLVVPSMVEVFPRGATRFSFSASRPFAVSTAGAPSRNWNALSFVRVVIVAGEGWCVLWAAPLAFELLLRC
jgi:hypothetical protein